MCSFNGYFQRLFFTSVKEINKLRKEINRLLGKEEINRLRREINRLLSKGMLNVYSKVTIEKN